MVDVKFSLGKRDFFWIGLIVILVGIGFVYGYGGSNPVVMGHNRGELEIPAESDPTVVNYVKDGVGWSEITGIPAGFGDGVDGVGSISCNWAGEILISFMPISCGTYASGGGTGIYETCSAGIITNTRRVDVPCS